MSDSKSESKKSNEDNEKLEPERKRVKKNRDNDYMTRIYYHPIRRVIKLFMTQKPTNDYLRHVFQDDKIIGSKDVIDTLKKRNLLDEKNEIFEHLIHVVVLKDHEPTVSVDSFGEIFNCFMQYHERQIVKKQQRGFSRPFRSNYNNFRGGGGGNYDNYPPDNYNNNFYSRDRYQRNNKNYNVRNVDSQRYDRNDNYQERDNYSREISKPSYDQNYPQRESSYRQQDQNSGQSQGFYRNNSGGGGGRNNNSGYNSSRQQPNYVNYESQNYNRGSDAPNEKHSSSSGGGYSGRQSNQYDNYSTNNEQRVGMKRKRSEW